MSDARMSLTILMLGGLIAAAPSSMRAQDPVRPRHEMLLGRVGRAPDRSFVPPADSGPTPFRIVRVNQDTGQAPQNEPSVRVNPLNPDNIVVAFRDFRLGWQPAIRNVTIAATTDAGRTWKEQFAQYANHDRYSDPTVGVDAAGVFYVGTLDYTAAGGSMLVTVRKSTDGGLHWLNAVPVSTDGLNFDKEILYADDCLTSPFSGNVYVAWDGTLGFARSTDGGTSFSTYGATLPVYRPAPATGPDGELYVVEAYAHLYLSMDGGETFGPMIDAGDSLRPPTDGVLTGSGV